MLENINEDIRNYELGRFRAQFTSSIADINTNPELTFHLRILFRQSPDHQWAFDSDNMPFPVNYWPPEEWTRFKQTIIDRSQRFWNGKFWLIPPAHCFHLIKYDNPSPLMPNMASTQQFLAYSQRPGYIAGLATSYNVYCKVRITETHSPSHAHLTITAPHLNEVDNGAYINSVVHGVGNFYSGVINTRNFDPVHGVTLGQHQYLHEIGHALGQRHIGFYSDTTMCEEAPHHSSGAGHSACYEGDNAAEASNVMGLGEQLSATNADPWLDFMAQYTHTDKAHWGVSMHRVYPRIVIGQNLLDANLNPYSIPFL